MAVLAFSVELIGGTAATGCCEPASGSNCCPEPSVGDLARQWKVTHDLAGCCPDPSGAVGCAAYGASGCRFCKDDCGDMPDDQCIACSSIPSGVNNTNEPPPAADPPIGGDNNSQPVFDPALDDDISGVFSDGDEPDVDWAEDIDRVLQPGSYYFGDDDYDCASCAWDNMPIAKQRLLTERSRSMVCDTTCLKRKGDHNYGVNMCNYFNAGRECRACCHVSRRRLNVHVFFVFRFFACCSFVACCLLQAPCVMIITSRAFQ